MTEDIIRMATGIARSTPGWARFSSAIPKLRQGIVLPGLPGTPEGERESAGSCHSGGLDRRCLDPTSGRSGPGDGLERHQQEHGLQAVQGDRRASERLSRAGRLEGEWPYLWLDATYLKVREGGRIVSVAAIIAVAVNTEGKREIVGLGLGPSEAETFWSGFLKGLAPTGPARRQAGDLRRARRAQGTPSARCCSATWQRCRVHWMRNALAHVPKGQHSMVAAALRQAFLQAGPGRCPAGLAAARRPASSPLAQARRPHGRQRARCAGLHELPQSSTGPSCTAPTRWSASTRRSSGGPTWSASSRTKTSMTAPTMLPIREVAEA